MKKQSKILIGIIAAVAVLAVVIISIVMTATGGSRDTYNSHMELAQRHLDELQYEQAIVEYNAAISIEPNNSEAYLGLADVYVAMGDIEKALEVLEEGYEQTGDERLLEKGTRISLDSISDTYATTYEENIMISGVESSPSIGGLSIIIEDYEVFTNGFHHEIPIDENSYNVVDFDKGISGYFSYSRELTEQEYENWGHGGEILDANGNRTNIDASFYSTTDGVFAVELPEYMPKGNYVYLLYQYISDEYCEARIAFTVNAEETPESKTPDPSDTYTTTYEENIVISEVESSPSIGGLSIIIEDYEIFTDGFHHEIPIDENSYSFIDYDKGISGHFSYSRELTEQEYENWGHGGEIFDTNGNKTNIDASFYSTTDGVFAVELPEYVPKGDYVYLLYMIINGEYCEARIAFTVD